MNVTDRMLWDDEAGTITLDDLQVDVLARAKQTYATGLRRLIIQGPCGCGKTIIAAEQTRRCLEMNRTALHIVHRRRLVDQMIATLAKFGILASPIMEGRQRWHAKAYCASRDTLLAMLKDGSGLPRADLILWDECHVAANALQEWYLANCPEAYWTGYTATPIRPNGNSLAPTYQALVSLAQPAELIRRGRLVPVKVFNPDAVGRRRRKGDKVKPTGDPVDHWKKYANDLPTVVFAATVRESQEICERYITAGISAEHLDASTPDEERERIFLRSQSGATRIICNCNVLVEGLDLPWLTCCQILRGCNSLVLWAQANGRIMRAFPGKEFGICLDHAAAAHEFGLPHRDFNWTLGDDKDNLRDNKIPKDQKPVVCPACGFVFARKPACPECGKVLPVKRRKSLLASVQKGDGVLTEFTEQQNRFIGQDTLRRLYDKCFYIKLRQGRTMREVAGMFSSEAGMPPWKAGLDIPLPCGKAEWALPVAEWLRRQRS